MKEAVLSSRRGWPGIGSRRRATGLERFEVGLGDVLFFDHRQRRASPPGRSSARPITVLHFAKRTQIEKLRFVFATGCEMSGCEFCETNPNESTDLLDLAAFKKMKPLMDTDERGWDGSLIRVNRCASVANFPDLFLRNEPK